VRRVVRALQADLDVPVIENPDVARGEADAGRGPRGRPRRRARGRRQEQRSAAGGEDGPQTRYCTFPVIAKCARRFRAQQASLDSWQSGISLPYETVFSRSAGTPSETR